MYLEERDILSIDHDVDHGVVHEGVEEPQQHHQEEEEVEDAETTVGAAVTILSLNSVMISDIR